MAEEGIVVVVVPTDKSGHLAGEPDLISRGFVFEQQAEDIMDAGKELVRSILTEKPDTPLDWRYTRKQIEDHLKKFFHEETGRNPLILPIVVEA